MERSRTSSVFLRELAKVEWDVAINMTGDLRGNFIAYADKGGAYLLSDLVPLTEVSQIGRARQLAEAIGATPSDHTALEPLPEDERAVERILAEHGIAPGDPALVIAPSAGYPTKLWPAERWAELISRVAHALPTTVVVGAGPRAHDRPFRAAGGTIVDLTGRLTLRQSGALMRRAALVVGSDSGAMHLAASFGAPTLTLFGPTRPERWQPRGSATHRVIDKREPCSPCGRLSSCPVGMRCMHLISVAEVEHAILEGIRADPPDQSLLASSRPTAG